MAVPHDDETDRRFRQWMLQRPAADDDAWTVRFLAWCLAVPDQDMLWFHQPEWVEAVKPVLYSRMRFNPILPDRTFAFAKNKLQFEWLPNDAYRALLIHAIRRIPSMSRIERDVARSLFMAMEENNVTGCVHVPEVASFRSALRNVTSLCARYHVELDRGYTYLPEDRRIVRSVVVCNTVVVHLLNAWSQAEE